MSIRHHRGLTYEVRKEEGGHFDVEYHVSSAHIGPHNESTFITTKPTLANADACARAMGGANIWLDVCIWSEEGARYFGGDDAVEQYLVDPEASVFCRYEIKANCVGMVP